MDTLPTEILQEIFSECRDLQLGDSQPLHSLCTDLDPWRVAQVCHTWRNAALSYPWLWDKLGIHFDVLTSILSPSCHHLAFLFGTYFFRSGDRTLDVTLTSKVSLNYVDREMLQTIVSLLAVSAPRWNRLSVCMLASNFWYMPGIRDLRRLESFQFCLSSHNLSVDGPGMVGNPTYILGTEQSSQVHTLELRLEKYGWPQKWPQTKVTDALIAITLPALKRLNIHSYSSSEDLIELSHFLQRSNCRLEYLELTIPNYSEIDIHNFLLLRPYVGSLKHLVLNIPNHRFIDRLLAELTSDPLLCPALQSLHIVQSYIPSSDVQRLRASHPDLVVLLQVN